MTDKLTRFWQDGVNLILGLWLIASPWILGFAGLQGAMWNAVAFGIIIAAMALAALTRFHDWEEWADMAVGVWLIVSPWVLGFAAASAVAAWNVAIVGVLTLALAGWSLKAHHDAQTA